MVVGLGTGSTAIHAVRRIGERLAAGEISNVVGVATSFESTIEAQRLGIPLCTLNDPAARDGLDLAIDGADEVEVATGYLIKGGGGALTREKLVEYSSRCLYVVVDESKLSERLGTLFRIPVEVIPDALAAARRDLGKLGLEPELRMAVQKAGPVVTDNGNLILDCHVSSLPIDPPLMERAINAIPGVLENGIFTGVETEVWVGRADGSVERVERQP
jgi:ribose 5-phosphate isomerase A